MSEHGGIRRMLNRAGRIKQALRARDEVKVEAYPHVECYSWRPRSGKLNFGDHLAEVIVDGVLARRGLMREEETAVSSRLFSIGSVLHFAQTGDTVWGSGVNGKIAEDQHSYASLDVRAVRGPRTAQFLSARGIAVPDVFGDPALLLPHLLPGRFTVTGDNGPIFVPNLNDLDSFESPIPVASPLRGWNHVVNQIVRSSLVLASSLHGLILAEAFGIPARYVRLSEHESTFKYADYYEGTGREGAEEVTSIEAGLERGGRDPVVFSAEKLLEAFPYDLWRQPEA